ncbi:MAG: DUF4159 domain-containing protein [Acidobacteria bacterium]|nr:DUF4159 domain-containing protein [Acidobacteriota bacterium]
MWNRSLRNKLFLLTGLLLIAMGLGLCVRAAAQGFGRRGVQIWEEMAADQDQPATEFIFARVRYNSRNRGFGGYGGGGWAHDYPDAEEHILQVANEATNIHLRKMSYVIVDLDNEEILKYPFLYFSEVGEMYLTEMEIANFREYLNRGGFAMIDDFDSQVSLDWFLGQMKRVFPERGFQELTIGHPLFHTFYEIPTLDLAAPYQARDGGRPTFYGYFDERGRLTMIINHNNDVGDFWEWIDQPRYPLEPSTEALRLGINYFIFAMTH